jgi:hypothetical protein
MLVDIMMSSDHWWRTEYLVQYALCQLPSMAQVKESMLD